MKFAQPFFLFFLICLISFSCEKELVNKPPNIKVTNTNNVSIQFPSDSVQLTATVTDPDDQVVTVHWSKISGDQSVIIETPDMISTWVKGLKEGEYSIQLRATDSHGAFIDDTITISCAPPELSSTVLNPSNNTDEVHLFGNNTSIDQTDPAAPELVGGSGTYLGDPVNIRGLLKFDISGLPENAVIYSAKLTLYSNHTPLNGQNGMANVGPDNSLFIQRVTSDWQAGSVSWTQQPEVTTDGQVAIPHTNESFLDVKDLDVTELVKEMAAENANHGFLLRLQNETNYNFRVFCSSKYSDETRHPKLELSYYIRD